MMKCPQCGATVKEFDTFCYACGTALETPEGTARKPVVDAEKSGLGPKPVRNDSRVFSYAGFWKRFAAWIIDFILLSIFSIPLSLILAFVPYPLGSFISLPISILISLLYYGLQESSVHQATIGKRALGIIVTDDYGTRLSFGRAAGRDLSKIISGLTLGIGFLIIGFTEKKQGLHDIIVGCLVIDK
jgi:uncharacterized RDD family membrane protein YckC